MPRSASGADRSRSRRVGTTLRRFTSSAASGPRGFGSCFAAGIDRGPISRRPPQGRWSLSFKLGDGQSSKPGGCRVPPLLPVLQPEVPLGRRGGWAARTRGSPPPCAHRTSTPSGDSRTLARKRSDGKRDQRESNRRSQHRVGWRERPPRNMANAAIGDRVASPAARTSTDPRSCRATNRERPARAPHKTGS
jgi:hypothetical protein